MSTSSLPRHLTSRRGAWVTLLLSALLAGAVIGALGGAEPVNDHGAPPVTSESARVDDLLAQLPGHDVQHLVLVATRTDGGPLVDEDLSRLRQVSAKMPETPGPDVVGPIPSDDRRAALLQVPVSVPTEDSGALRAVVEEVRGAAAERLPDTLRVQTTGGPAFGADLAASFDGANVRLLAMTVAIVAILLLLTYRSPILWLVPVVVVGVADQVAAALTGAMGDTYGLNFDAGIISVLVFGAGANYALLLISRYREELRRHDDHRAALIDAWRGTVPAILASNVSVVLALATLTLGVIPGTRGIGLAGAVGLLIALAAALLALPAALAVVGRGAFWPFVPRHTPENADGGHGDRRDDERPARRRDAWGAVAAAVVRRPRRVLAAGSALLAVMALGLVGTEVGLAQADRFRVAAESAEALDTISAHYPAGAVQPFVVVTRPDQLDAVASAARGVEGVESVTPGVRGAASAGEVATLRVVADVLPGSDQERDLVGELREAVHAVPKPGALVGGAPATDADLRAGAEADLRFVAPLVLAVVAAILALLLRSLIAPVVLLAVNIASTIASIGAGAWLGRVLFGFPALDTPVPLLAFLFLVALGVDYTIFLVHRVRHEATRVGTRAAVVRGVSTTGVVVTSAGIVLAGVFAALGVLPLVTLGQLGLIVGLGVVVDTMVVRTLLVPALITVLGNRFWWPSRPDRQVGEASTAKDGARRPVTMRM